MACCQLRDGVHDTYCSTNNEMQFYRCAKCDQPVWMAAMSYGMCKACLGPPITNLAEAVAFLQRSGTSG